MRTYVAESLTEVEYFKKKGDEEESCCSTQTTPDGRQFLAQLSLDRGNPLIGETAVALQAEMWLMPVSVFVELECLEKLDLKSNQLNYLPTSISQLQLLKQLDASDNKLVSLDPSICDLGPIEKFEPKATPRSRCSS